MDNDIFNDLMYSINRVEEKILIDKIKQIRELSKHIRDLKEIQAEHISSGVDIDVPFEESIKCLEETKERIKDDVRKYYKKD